jgi:predicted transcriptional regulator
LRKLERAIILHLLSIEGERRRSCEQLAAELGEDQQALQEPLGRLASTGVVCLGDGEVSPSPAARRLDELGLIGI